MTEEQRAELHRQLTSVLGLTLAHADFQAIDGFFADLIDANAAEIGGDTAAFKTHVSAFFSHAAEAGRTDPQGAAAHVAEVLIRLHAPHG
jgi:hypothetical protein